MYVNYVKKSNEFARTAEASLVAGDFDAAVSSAIHAALTMADALSVFYLSQRSAERDHDLADELLARLPLERSERNQNLRHLEALLQVKSAAEYEERLMTESAARTAVQHETRFRRWAQSKLPEAVSQPRE